MYVCMYIYIYKYATNVAHMLKIISLIGTPQFFRKFLECF